MQAGKRTLWLALSCGLTLLVGGALADVLEPPAPVVKNSVLNTQAANSAPTFVHTTGKVSTDFGGIDVGYSVALQPDGRIVAVGTSKSNGKYDFALARYLADGTLDTGFGKGGKVSTDFGGGDYGYSVALQPDGRIVAVGASNGNFALARYLADGTLDTGFGKCGKVSTAFSGGDYGYSVALQPDGRIVVAGGTSPNDFALARYLADGTLDTGFGTGGKVSTDFGGDDYGYSVALQPDGRIVAGGTRISNGKYDFALARYRADGSLDTGFGPIEDTLAHQPGVGEQSAVTLGPRAEILDPELDAIGTYDGGTLTIARQGGANPDDVFSAKSGGSLTVLTPGSYFAVDSVTIGQVLTNSGGTLQLRFLGANATQARVDKAMQQIAYTNTSDRPPAQVLIDWTFDDGNTGAQGTGGALSTTGTVTVNITPVNDSPQVINPLPPQAAAVGQSFSFTVPAEVFTDADGDTLTYSLAMADNTGVPPWLSFNPATRTLSGTPSAGDVGTLNMIVTAKDPSNASAAAYLTLRVTAVTTTSGLNAAVLPTARSVQIGQPATAFGTIVNATGLDSWGCYLALPVSAAIPATFNYQTTNASNQLVGTPNTPIDIPAGGSQSFVFGITPSAAFAATDIPVVFDCANTLPAPSQIGLNTFLLSASSTPVPDMVAIGATPSGDGVLRIPGSTGVHAFGTAAVNIGGAGEVTVTVDTGGESLPLTLTVCQTNPGNGQCLSPAASSATSTLNTNSSATYAVFAQASGAIPFDPAGKRIFLRLSSGGVVRGATSVAVTTQ